MGGVQSPRSCLGGDCSEEGNSSGDTGMQAALSARSFATCLDPTVNMRAAAEKAWRQAQASFAIAMALAVTVAVPPLATVLSTSPVSLPFISHIAVRASGPSTLVPATVGSRLSVTRSGVCRPEESGSAPAGAAPTRFRGAIVQPAALPEVLVASPSGHSCDSEAVSTLATFGYSPGVLAKMTPGVKNAGEINKAIKAACDSGVSAPQVGAQVLKAATVDVSTIGTILNQGFSLAAADAASVLLAVGFSATAIATHPLNPHAPTAAPAPPLPQTPS